MGKLAEYEAAPNYSNAVCSCGRHYGTGTHTPEARAELYRRCVESGVADESHVYPWLADWQAVHGEVHVETTTPRHVRNHPLFLAAQRKRLDILAAMTNKAKRLEGAAEVLA